MKYSITVSGIREAVGVNIPYNAKTFEIRFRTTWDANIFEAYEYLTGVFNELRHDLTAYKLDEIILSAQSSKLDPTGLEKMAVLIGSIGKLPRRTTLYVNFRLEGIDAVLMGNIKHLYSHSDYLGFSVFDGWIRHLHKTRIMDIGSLINGVIHHARDAVTIATNILEDPKALHDYNGRFPVVAFHLREQRDLVRAYNDACTQFALMCALRKYPKDVMRLITAMICPEDWKKGRSITTKNPKWASQVIEAYKVGYRKRVEAQIVLRMEQELVSELEEHKRCVEKLPDEIEQKKKKRQRLEEEADKESKNVEVLKSQMRRDGYGRFYMPRKRK